MKLIASAAVMLCASLALAHGEVTINWPSVNGLAVNNACATASTFKSLTPVATCTETKTMRYAVSNGTGEQGQTRRLLRDGEALRHGEWLETETVCTAHGSQALEVSRDVVVTECAHYTPPGEGSEPCTEFVSHTVKAGLTYSVEKIVDYGEAQQQTFFNFTIPACN